MTEPYRLPDPARQLEFELQEAEREAQEAARYEEEKAAAALRYQKEHALEIAIAEAEASIHASRERMHDLQREWDRQREALEKRLHDSEKRTRIVTVVAFVMSFPVLSTLSELLRRVFF